MVSGINILAIIKYVVAITILICIVLAPTYLSAVTDRDKINRMRCRCGVLLFAWTVVGWFYSLFVATKK